MGKTAVCSRQEYEYDLAWLPKPWSKKNIPLQFICSIFLAVLSIILYVLALKTGGNVDINVKAQNFFKIFAIVVFTLTILGDVFVFIVHDYLIYL